MQVTAVFFVPFEDDRIDQCMYADTRKLTPAEMKYSIAEKNDLVRCRQWIVMVEMVSTPGWIFVFKDACLPRGVCNVVAMQRIM